MADAHTDDGARRELRSSKGVRTPLAMTACGLTSYDFAVLRAVPHVHLGAFVPVGVVVHARTLAFLGLRALTEAADLAARVPDVDHDLLARYLKACCRVAEGDPSAGPVALAPPSERFHWLTAPRSDVLQCSPIHAGLTDDPARALESLFAEYVLAAAPSTAPGDRPGDG